MKPARFGYLAARSAEEAVDALADGRTRVLAGGQSLVLEMNYRATRPERLVDVNRVPEFDQLEVVDGALVAGPLARHRAFEAGLEGPLGRLLSRVAHHIAHPPIRSRGTMLGSLAYAHPAAEWPGVAVTFDASVELVGPGGARTVPAADFITGPFRTARADDELLRRVRLPLLPPDTGVGFAELRRTAASFAQLAAIATLTLRDGRVEQARLGLVHAADRPVRAVSGERVLVGQAPGDELFADAAAAAARHDADPMPQPYTDETYQRHAIAVLLRRALKEAHRDAGN